MIPKEDYILDGSMTGAIPDTTIPMLTGVEEKIVDGDVFDGNTNVFLGNLDLLPESKDFQVKLHLKLGDFWYEYVLVNKFTNDT